MKRLLAFRVTVSVPLLAASVHETIESGAIGKASGQVVHELNAHGQTTTLRETWSLRPSR